MPSRALTAAAVSRLKPPQEGQVDHFDKGYPGLALRISYGGTKTWVYFHRLHGRQYRHTLGTWPAMELGGAREAWQAARTMVGKGENPARRGRRPPTASRQWPTNGSSATKRTIAPTMRCSASLTVT